MIQSKANYYSSAKNSEYFTNNVFVPIWEKHISGILRIRDLVGAGEIYDFSCAWVYTWS